MEIHPFLRGLIIGFSIAAPVGPIGILCIRRTLAYGRRIGLVSGLGAASADALYGAIAAFGLSLVANFLIGFQEPLQLAGGVFLGYLGIKTLLAAPSRDQGELGEANLLASFASTFFLTLTNPITILAFAAIFTGLGLVGEGGDLLAASLMVLGVFLGSALWWFLLSGGVSLFQRRIHDTALLWINRLAGALILVYAILAVSNGIFD